MLVAEYLQIFLIAFFHTLWKENHIFCQDTRYNFAVS